MSGIAPTQGANQMPVPMGVVGETGETHPPMTADDLHHISQDSAVVLARSQRGPVLAVDSSVDDQTDLNQTGWGVLFASDADPAIKEALQPLLALRKAQVNDDRLFRVFEGLSGGVRPGQTAGSWALNKGVSLAAPVSPRRGVPFYLLIVGSPARIPFEFQAQLDLQWAVGRLYFDCVEDYASYAQKVVDYETDRALMPNRRAALWMPRNARDLATPMLAGAVGGDFLGQTSLDNETLGQRQNFKITSFVGENQASFQNLNKIFNGEIEGGPPSVVFTGSHGAEWSIDTPDIQKQRQGALVTQEWARGQPLQEGQYFSGRELPDDAKVRGMMVFLFACFGGGCPQQDSYRFNDDGSKIQRRLSHSSRAFHKLYCARVRWQ